MIVFDDTHLAYWERSKRTALEHLSHDKRVCVMYSNFKAQRDGVLESGFLRFFGNVERHEPGPSTTLFSRTPAARADPRRGRYRHRALLKIEKAIDIRGKPIL